MAFPGKIYFISEHTEQDLVHGGIGPADIETILLRRNAIPLRFPFRYNFSFKAKIGRLVALLKILGNIRPQSVVIFQHPLYATMNMWLLRLLRFRPSITIFCIIADIDGLKDKHPELLATEMKLFRRFNYFIVHNLKMEAWLKSFHSTAVTSLLETFDFLTGYSEYRRRKSTALVFAGNLDKSRFLEKAHEWLTESSRLSMNLYGPGLTERMLTSPSVVHKGVFNPYTLPRELDGSFGLVWDGEGLEKPGGSFGEYMAYICHHKLSLYITANLPVIVHHNAGSADLVRRFNIGFAIESLFEIEKKIKDLSDVEYEQMVINTRQLAKNITSGKGIENALDNLLEKMESVKR